MPKSSTRKQLLAASRPLIADLPRLSTKNLQNTAKTYYDQYLYWECLLVLLAARDLARLKQEQQDPVLDMRIAIAFRNLGRYTEALLHLDEVSKQHKLPPNVACGLSINRAVCYRGMGNYSSALLALDQATKLSEIAYGREDWIIPADRGAIYFYQGQMDLALKEYRRSLKLRSLTDQSVDPDSFMNIGIVLLNQGKLREALKYLNKGEGEAKLQKRASNPLLFINRAYARLQLGAYDSANNDLRNGIIEFARQARPIPAELAELIAVLAELVCDANGAAGKPVQNLGRKAYHVFIGYRTNCEEILVDHIATFLTNVLGLKVFCYLHTGLDQEVKLSLHNKLRRSKCYLLVLANGTFVNRKSVRDGLMSEINVVKELNLPACTIATPNYDRHLEMLRVPRSAQWLARYDYVRIKPTQPLEWKARLESRLRELRIFNRPGSSRDSRLTRAGK